MALCGGHKETNTQSGSYWPSSTRVGSRPGGNWGTGALVQPYGLYGGYYGGGYPSMYGQQGLIQYGFGGQRIPVGSQWMGGLVGGANGRIATGRGPSDIRWSYMGEGATPAVYNPGYAVYGMGPAGVTGLPGAGLETARLGQVGATGVASARPMVIPTPQVMPVRPVVTGTVGTGGIGAVGAAVRPGGGAIGGGGLIRQGVAPVGGGLGTGIYGPGVSSLARYGTYGSGYYGILYYN